MTKILPPEIAKAAANMPAPPATNDPAAAFELKLKAQMDKEAALFKALSAEFSDEAYSKDNSRGFALTSIRAQYVVERLNEVLGIAGWSMSGTFEQVKDAQGNLTGVLYFGELQASLGSRLQKIQSPGYAKNDAKKNLGDLYKGAKTDSLSKAASWLGVGNSVFKGEIDPNTIGHHSAESKPVTNGKTSSFSARSTTKQDPFS